MELIEGAALQLPLPTLTDLAAGLDEVAESERLLRKLRGLLKHGDAVEELANQTLDRLTRGLALLHVASAAGAAAPKSEEDEVDSLLPTQLPATVISPCYRGATDERPGTLGRRCRAGIIGRPEKKAGPRRRSHPYALREITSATLEDGYTWRKYGQKDIQNSSEPRSYYRCTYKKNRGCQAQRQAQKLEDGSRLYHITYFGDHTCNLSDPAIAHQNRNAQQGQHKLPPGSKLISFVSEDAGLGEPPLPATSPAACKQEPAALHFGPAEVANTSTGKTEPHHVAESASGPPPFSGFYCEGTHSHGNASPGQSSAGSATIHEDLEYMEDDLVNFIMLRSPDSYSLYY